MKTIRDTGRITNVQVEGIDYKDYPDFCDAFIASAEWDDGTELTSDELDELSDEFPNYVYECIYGAAIG